MQYRELDAQVGMFRRSVLVPGQLVGRGEV